MSRKNVKYRKYKGPQKGNPMWRDPAQSGNGCAVVAVAAIGAVVAVTTIGVTLLV